MTEHGDYVRVFDDGDTDSERLHRLRNARRTIEFMIGVVCEDMSAENGKAFDSIMSIIENGPTDGMSPSVLKNRIRMRTALGLGSDDVIERVLNEMNLIGLIKLVALPRHQGARGARPERYMIA